MSDHNKWIMFKNYMHNELGITKEDIRTWTQEAVEKAAVDYLNRSSVDKSWTDKLMEHVYAKVSHALFSDWNSKNAIREAIAAALVKNLHVTIRQNVEK